MKKIIITLFVLLLTSPVFSQKWITDSNFEDKVHENHPFGDDDVTITVVEFWADFNKDNEFKQWELLKGVTYFRCDVESAPKARKKYRVRMAPTILVFVDGVMEKSFKAGLDLVLHDDLETIQQEIDDLRQMSKF